MKTSIEILVEKIFEWLQRCGSTVSSKRRPGIDASQVITLIEALKLKAPDQLVDFYGCYDGIWYDERDTLGDIQLFPGFYWMSLSEALARYRAISPSDQWQKSWFPILGNGGGDFYAVICDEKSLFFGEIVGFMLGEPVQVAEFRDIQHMLETIERSFVEGAFYATDTHLGANFKRMSEIAHEVRPDFAEHKV